MPREDFLEYVKENHTAESNINEELVAKTIDFAGSSLKRKEEIAATVADNFTKEEIRKMTEQGKLTVVHGENVIANIKADAAHVYRSERYPSEVQINNKADQTAITHEFVHHLRVEDQKRRGLSKTAYNLDENGCVIPEPEHSKKRFAEECAVSAETEIRTKEPTNRPNTYFCKLDKKTIIAHTKEHEWSYNVERSTMRTKANAIKTNELIPVYKEAPEKDRMSEGVNLRGKQAIDMFDRNFKRSRLGNAPKSGNENEKSNIELIDESHKKR